MLRTIRSFVLAAILAASACDAGNPFVPVIPNVEPKMVSLSVTGYTSPMEKKDSVQMICTRKFDRGPDQPCPPGVVWASSDSTIATVGATGLVKAVAPGTATVTASYNGVTGTAQVVVKVPTLVSVAIVGDSVQERAGWHQYKLVGKLSDGSERNLSDSATWSVQGPLDPIVAGAEASGGGMIYIYTRGSFKVIATYKSLSGALGVVVTGTPRSRLVTMSDTVWVIIMNHLRTGNGVIIRQDSTVASVWIPTGIAQQDLNEAMAFWKNEDPRILFYQVPDSAGASVRYRFDPSFTWACASGGMDGDIQVNPASLSCFDKETLAHEMGRWLGFQWDWKPDWSDIMSDRGVWKSDPLRTEVLQVLYSIPPYTIPVG